MSSLSALREEVCEANLELVRLGLVVYTWGNVSGIDRDEGLVVIKPSGVSYDEMRPEQMVVVRLDDGAIVEGDLNPSSDTPTHLALYRAFESIGGVSHTHSAAATAWAQAQRDLPCFGTTHADNFYGAVPVTDAMTPEEIARDYEAETGAVIIREFRESSLDPAQVPAALVANHGPFTWGKDAASSVVNARVLEECARMALATITITPDQSPISQALLDKHFLRKHGPGAYYGQK